MEVNFGFYRRSVIPVHAASEATRQNERHCRGRPRIPSGRDRMGIPHTFTPIAIETYMALLKRLLDLLSGSARAFFAHDASYASSNIIVIWCRQLVVVPLHHAEARATHARRARLETSSTLLILPPRANILLRTS